MTAASAKGRNLLRVLAFLALAGFYFAVLNARPDFSRFNAHDSENYLALSYSLVHGLGYTRSMDPGRYLPHVTWPPGVPVLMMPAMALSGERVDWRLVKGTMALVGLLGVVLAWYLVRRVTEDPPTADWAALALGLNPFYWDFSHQAMAEVPLTVWILGSLWLIDRFWARRAISYRAAFGVGLILGVGMMFKGHAGALLLAPLAYLVGPRRGALDARAHWARWGVYALGFVVVFALWSLHNRGIDTTGLGDDGISQLRMLRHTDPMDPDSPLLTWRQSLDVVLNNLRYAFVYVFPQQILPGLWRPEAWAWSGSGVMAVLLTLGLLTAGLWSAGRFPVLLVVAAPMAALNLVIVQGGAARYWVPLSSLLLVALFLSTGRWLSRRGRGLQGLGAVLLAANLGWYVLDHEQHPYRSDRPLAELAELMERVARMPLVTQGVATPHRFAFRLITGYPAPMILPGRGLDPLLDHLVLDGGRGPPGAHLVLSVPPWNLVALDHPRHASELIAEGWWR